MLNESEGRRPSSSFALRERLFLRRRIFAVGRYSREIYITKLFLRIYNVRKCEARVWHSIGRALPAKSVRDSREVLQH